MSTPVTCTEPAETPRHELSVRFVSPMPGLEEYDRFALSSIDDSPVYWLQCVAEPAIAMPLAEASMVDRGYAFELPDQDTRALRIERPEDAQVLVVLTVGREQGAITANLMAPVVVNRRHGLARQLILDDKRYSLRHPVTSL
jgi:flagellar assembly factor FliW